MSHIPNIPHAAAAAEQNGTKNKTTNKKSKQNPGMQKQFLGARFIAGSACCAVRLISIISVAQVSSITGETHELKCLLRVFPGVCSQAHSRTVALPSPEGVCPLASGLSFRARVNTLSRKKGKEYPNA